MPQLLPGAVSFLTSAPQNCQLIPDAADPQVSNGVPTISVQAFTPILGTLLLSSNPRVGGPARYAVVDLLQRMKRADRFDQENLSGPIESDLEIDFPPGLFRKEERALFETEILWQVVIGMGRLDVDVDADVDQQEMDADEQDVFFTPQPFSDADSYFFNSPLSSPNSFPLTKSDNINPYFVLTSPLKSSRSTPSAASSSGSDQSSTPGSTRSASSTTASSSSSSGSYSPGTFERVETPSKDVVMESTPTPSGVYHEPTQNTFSPTGPSPVKSNTSPIWSSTLVSVPESTLFTPLLPPKLDISSRKLSDADAILPVAKKQRSLEDEGSPERLTPSPEIDFRLRSLHTATTFKSSPLAEDPSVSPTSARQISTFVREVETQLENEPTPTDWIPSAPKPHHATLPSSMLSNVVAQGPPPPGHGLASTSAVLAMTAAEATHRAEQISTGPEALLSSPTTDEAPYIHGYVYGHDAHEFVEEGDGSDSEQAAVGRLSSMSLMAAVTASGRFLF